MRSSIRRTWRSVTFNRLAAATCVRCFCFTSCNTFNRSRSRWLKAMRSVSMGPSANHESGHFYFAQTGHSHFAATPALANAEQHPPHLAVGYFQPLGCSYLRQMLLLYLVQHFQSVPFSLAQGDALRFHGALGQPCKRTFLLCTNRTFSFCGHSRNFI